MFRVMTFKERIALLFSGSLWWLSFICLPYQVSTYTDRYGIDLKHSGWIASAELLSLAVAAIFCAFGIEKKNKRAMVFKGAFIALAGMIVSYYCASLMIVIPARLFIGIGLGMVSAGSNALPAMFREPEKIYAQMLGMMAVMFACIMFAIPYVLEKLSNRGFDITEIVTLLIVVPFIAWLPEGKNQQENVASAATEAVQAMPKKAKLLLVGIFALLLAQCGVWAFAESAGTLLHLSAGTISLTFTFTALLQLPAAVLVSLQGKRLGFALPVTATMLLHLLVALAVYCVDSSMLWIISIAILAAICTYGLAYMLGMLAEIDASGKSSAISGAAINLGSAAGPVLGSVLFSLGGTSTIGIGFAAVLALGYLAMLPVLMKKKTVETIAHEF